MNSIIRDLVYSTDILPATVIRHADAAVNTSSKGVKWLCLLFWNRQSCFITIYSRVVTILLV